MNHDNCVGDDGSVKQNAWGSSFPQWSVLLLLPSLPAQHPIQPNARGRGRDIPCPAHAAPSWEPLARLEGPANPSALPKPQDQSVQAFSAAVLLTDMFRARPHGNFSLVC